MDPTMRYITKIARSAVKYASGALRKSGIGYTEYECLRAIRKNEGINQERISELLNIDKAAVTRMIGNLEKKGFVHREKDMSNKRRNVIRSTEKSLSIKFDEAGAESVFYEWLLEDVTPADREIFKRVLSAAYTKSKNARIGGFAEIKAWEARNTEPR